MEMSDILASVEGEIQEEQFVGCSSGQIAKSVIEMVRCKVSIGGVNVYLLEHPLQDRPVQGVLSLSEARSVKFDMGPETNIQKLIIHGDI